MKPSKPENIIKKNNVVTIFSMQQSQSALQLPKTTKDSQDADDYWDWYERTMSNE